MSPCQATRPKSEWEGDAARDGGRAVSALPATFHIDPWNPVARAVITHAHGDHARPGQRGLSLRRARRRRCSARRFGSRRARSRPMPYGQPLTLGDVTRQLPSGRPRPRLGADPRRGRRTASGSVGRRLQARRRSDLRAVRAGPVRHLHHRIDLRPARSTAGTPTASRHRRHRRLVAGERAPRASRRCCSATRSARRSASSPSSRAAPIGRCSCTA